MARPREIRRTGVRGLRVSDAKEVPAPGGAALADIPPDYRPSEDEPYMNPRQLEYFRRKLLRWREEILRGSDLTLRHLKEGEERPADHTDWASAEIHRYYELRTRDRERKLLAKIDAALRRIEEGTYGYCEETGEPIGIRRLEARPVATLSIEAQERHEKRERTYRDR